MKHIADTALNMPCQPNLPTFTKQICESKATTWQREPNKSTKSISLNFIGSQTYLTGLPLRPNEKMTTIILKHLKWIIRVSFLCSEFTTSIKKLASIFVECGIVFFVRQTSIATSPPSSAESSSQLKMVCRLRFFATLSRAFLLKIFRWKKNANGHGKVSRGQQQICFSIFETRDILRVSSRYLPYYSFWAADLQGSMVRFHLSFTYDRSHEAVFSVVLPSASPCRWGSCAQEPLVSYIDTVDGRNPAPVD